MKLMQPVRGTHDLFGEDVLKYRTIHQRLATVCARYGFSEIKTPIFEFSHVFERTLGDSSDIVTKEMYSFIDKGGEAICLRPEGTASVVRAFISEGLTHSLPLKFFYEGPMFRYERPQKGRYRQFYQVGVELMGVESEAADVEVLSLSHNLLSELKLNDKVKLEINSIGDAESRSNYRKVLVDYYNGHKNQLSEDSLKRLETNPLRILDSKSKSDSEINKNAPLLIDHLNPSSKSRFLNIQGELKNLGIGFSLNPHLVRGLDYYSHLVFEYKTDLLGAQDAVLSGGRYDGLSEVMGGPKTPSVGWAAGVERLSALLTDTEPHARGVTLIPLGDKAKSHALKLSHELRKSGLVVDLGYSGNLSSRLQKATKRNSKIACIFGDEELSQNVFSVKNLDAGTQEKINGSELEAHLRKLLS